MKYYLLILFGALVMVGVAGCGGAGDPSSTAEAQPVLVPAPNPNTDRVRSFKLIPQHSEILLNTGQITGEEVVSAQVSATALVGTSTVQTMQSASFLPGELVVLLGEDGNYHTEKVQVVDTFSIVLTRPLRYQVSAGQTLWNFYSDYTHPQRPGYSAIADYAYEVMGPISGGTHVFLGDSWFADTTLMTRIQQKASPTAIFINKGVGGNRVQDLINRFDIDVTPNNPTYVWVMAGTNDYFGYAYSSFTPTSTYTASMQILINKIKSIGAQPIVFDPSVGPQSYLNCQDFELKVLSDQYTEAVSAIVW